MATDTDQLAPLYPLETEATIRARWDAWANEGLTEEQTEEWTDTREGGFFQIATQGGVREAARVYDLIGTEFIQAATPIHAWGPYLDDHAAVQSVVRAAARPATGSVTFTGENGVVIAPGVRVGVEPTQPDADAPEYEVTLAGTIAGGTGDDPGTVTVPVGALVAGVAGNVSAGAISLILTPGLQVDVTNAARISGGTEIETDESLRGRLLDAYRGQGPGNVTDYKAWTRAYLGGGRVTVIPLWDGPGTVKVIAIDANGDPLQDDVIEGLQDFLSPAAGEGGGEAPVGATVTVETADPFAVALSAALEFEAGYSLDGAAGTIALLSTILARVGEYVETVEPGDEIVVSQVIGKIVAITGVHDVTDVELNGVAANLAVDDDPPALPFLDAETSELTVA
jgi:uncharacterized phage protein gp47/JayE